MTLPRVAIVGRPNVGKSTLFNRLSGSRKAIVDPVAGSTRDRNTVIVEWGGRSFELVETSRSARKSTPRSSAPRSSVGSSMDVQGF